MKNTSFPNSVPVFFLGVDVGKSDLFCHILQLDVNFSERFDNNEPGISKLISWLKSKTLLDQTIACLEQTGHYSKPLAKALFSLGLYGVHVVNPRCIKAFANRRLRRNKSDKADARLIAQFVLAEHADLQPWCPQLPENEQLTELSRYVDSITSDIAKLKTRSESVTNPFILKSLKRRILSMTKELTSLRLKITNLIKSHPTIRVQHALLRSIPGIGEITAQTLLAELPDIKQFQDARQLAAWAGLTPRHFSSGTSGRATTPISKIGSGHLRQALFLPSMTARTNNPLLKAFADRLLSNGKKPKQIIIAIMRKLLHQVYGILSSGEPYNPDILGSQPSN